MTITLTDIVTGKPVPRRASVRQRVSVRESEILAVPPWVAATHQPLGEWLLRLVEREQGRRLRRANSCLAIGDPGMPLPAAASAVRDFYASRGRDVLAQVESGSETDEALVRLGWIRLEPADAPYLVGSLVMAGRVAGTDEGVAVTVEGTRVLATSSRDGVEVGRARAELNGDWLGVHGLWVEESQRRKGLGRRLTSGLLRTGAELGARTVWLEVERGNVAARTLYAGLGLREHHVCRYLRGPQN